MRVTVWNVTGGERDAQQPAAAAALVTVCTPQHEFVATERYTQTRQTANVCQKIQTGQAAGVCWPCSTEVVVIVAAEVGVAVVVGRVACPWVTSHTSGEPEH